MYRAPLPRTKLLSPLPAARFAGAVDVDGRELDAGRLARDGGPQLGRRARRALDLDARRRASRGADGHLARRRRSGAIKVGPLTTPWIANGALSLDGERHALGGPEQLRRTEVDESPDRLRFVLAGQGRDACSGTVSAPSARTSSGWVYADPDGSEHHTVNCSVADMTLEVDAQASARCALACAGGAAYELGMRERDHGMAIQPFPDG